MGMQIAVPIVESNGDGVPSFGGVLHFLTEVIER
jgi:hypothetical protein